MYLTQTWITAAFLGLLTVSVAEVSAGEPANPDMPAAADMHNSRNALDWAGAYEGLLPCADCAGIRTRLTLGADGIYYLDTEQLRADARVLSASGYFSWLPDGNTVFLGDAGDDRLFAVGEGRLIELNADGSRPDPADRILNKLPAGQAASDAPTAAFLQDHTWRLESAVDGGNQRIEALFPKDRPFEFRFNGGNMAVSGGCNGLRGGYQITTEGQLVAGRMASTMMACEPALMAADTALSGLLAEPLRIMLVQGAQPTLVLLSPANAVLVLKGQKTPEALYGPATRVFLEVAAKTVSCKDGTGGQCLRVREIRFDEKGLRAGSPGKWRPFAGSIDGYQHVPGVRNVLRVNRYQPPAGAPAVYVLDLVVESETVKK